MKGTLRRQAAVSAAILAVGLPGRAAESSSEDGRAPVEREVGMTEVAALEQQRQAENRRVIVDERAAEVQGGGASEAAPVGAKASDALSSGG